MNKKCEKTFEILRSEITFLMDLYRYIDYWYIAPQMEHSFSFLKLYMKVSSPWEFACA